MVGANSLQTEYRVGGLSRPAEIFGHAPIDPGSLKLGGGFGIVRVDDPKTGDRKRRPHDLARKGVGGCFGVGELPQ